MIRRIALAAIIALVASSIPQPVNAKAHPLSIIDLGTLPGGLEANAYDINRSGQVIGAIRMAPASPFVRHAFVWQDGVMTDLGGGHTVATAINDRGQVVGFSLTSDRALLWQDGVMTDLGTLGGLSSATDINNRGQIVGYYEPATAVSPVRAFLWQDGVMADLGTPDGFYAAAINKRGQILITNGRKSYRWQDGVMTDLGSLGGSQTIARAINDRGQIVGIGETPNAGEYHAFLWQDGVMTDLGSLGGSAGANDINNRGQVVGVWRGTTGDRAFLWQDGVMSDLGMLAGDVESGASAINNRGQVVGSSCAIGYRCHAVMWTP